MKKLIIIILMILVGLSTGCSEDKRTAKQIFLDSIGSHTEINSTTFSGKMDVVIDSNMEMEVDEITSALLMLNQFSIAFNGKGNDEPLQMEMDTTLTTNIQGMDLEFKVPMLSKDDSLYIKVPAMMKSIFSFEKEYLVADISNKTTAEDKTELINLFNIILNDIDDSSFTKIDRSSYSIKDVKVGDVVAINITQESIKTFLDNFTIDGLPELISADTIVNEINKKLTINKLEMINVYDKDGYLRKIIFDVDVRMMDEEKGDFNVVIKGECIIETINEELQFEIQIPTTDQTEKIEELNLF